MKRLRISALLLLLAVPVLQAAASDGFVVIVNASRADTIDRSEISDIFMKRMTHWKSDGAAIEPVDQIPASPSRTRFSDVVLRRNVAAMQAFWQQQIFSGRDVPPVEKSNDDKVIEFVREHPGAIGYVSADRVLAGVRVVSWQ